jgi:hypothetical protein
MHLPCPREGDISGEPSAIKARCTTMTVATNVAPGTNIVGRITHTILRHSTATILYSSNHNIGHHRNYFQHHRAWIENTVSCHTLYTTSPFHFLRHTTEVQLLLLLTTCDYETRRWINENLQQMAVINKALQRYLLCFGRTKRLRRIYVVVPQIPPSPYFHHV